MSFDLTTIALIVGLAIVYLGLVRPNGRRWFLLAVSVLALFWLQPRLPVRFGGYLLPLFLLLLTITLWFVFVRDRENGVTRDDWLGVAVVMVVSLLVAQARYLSLPLSVYSIRPPGTSGLLLGLIAMATDVEGLYASVKALVCATKSNDRAQKEMERIRGYQVMPCVVCASSARRLRVVPLLIVSITRADCCV